MLMYLGGVLLAEPDGSEVWSSLKERPTFRKCLLGPAQHAGGDPVFRTPGPTSPVLVEPHQQKESNLKKLDLCGCT